jgi:hypothetical protein
MYKYNVVSDASGLNASITIVTSEGEVRTIDTSHANYARVHDALTNGFPEYVYPDVDDDYYSDYSDDEFYIAEEEWLLEQTGNAFNSVVNGMQKLSERVTYDGETIFFDRDPLDTILSRHLVRTIKSGGEYGSLVNFMEKLADNPSPLSRRQVFRWLETYDFTLTADGDIVGYKAVAGPENRSINGGTNTVYVTLDEETVTYTGRIPNPVGAVVEIARGEVDEDRQRACSYGLHVGTHRYAKAFGRGHWDHKILRVAVNPRDVVSVPAGEDEKFRTARYVVLDEEGTEKSDAPVLNITAGTTTFSATFPPETDEVLREF